MMDESVGELVPSVFINVPFDDAYEPLFDALLFASVCCGFHPRSALESGSAGVSRLARIITALGISRYSFHDLSRCQGAGELNLARFNMPLELGMAIARSEYGEDESHEWFAMVPSGHDYRRFASDLLGFDLKDHTGTAETIVPPFMAWLMTREVAEGDLTPRDVLAALPLYLDRKKHLLDAWAGDVPWSRLVLAATNCVPVPS